MIDDLLRSLMTNLTAQGGSAPLAYALFSGKPPTPKQEALVQSWLPEQSAWGAPYGDPSIPAMSPQPLEGTLRTGGALGQAGLPADGAQGYTADVLQHLKDVISGKVAYEGALGPGYTGDNRALDIATGFGPGAIRLFHGAARPFAPAPGAPLGRFDPNRIGSGEGFHGEGRGGYASESPRVAEWYQREYGEYPPDVVAAAKARLAEEYPAGSGIDSTSGLRHHFTGEEADYAEYLKKTGLDPQRGSEWVRAADREAGFDPGMKGGALYEMEHPTADPEHFLRWDLPLDEQSSYVLQRLRRLGVKPTNHPYDTNGMEIFNHLAGKYGPAAEPGKFSWDDLSRGDEQAANVLKLAGIRGIRYPAGGMAGKQGAFNYSIFEPEALNVLRRLDVEK